MGATLTLLDLAGMVALLLWGVHMVQSGIQRAYGPDLRRMLGSALGSRFRAVLAGIGVTAALQSSTATGLMASSFAAGGFVDLVPALAVMLGANIGTTLIVQVLSFDVVRIAPLFVLAGVIMFRRGGSTRARDLGRVAIGLGLMLLALAGLLEILTPYEDSPPLRSMLGMVVTDPFVAIMLAALVTWVAHSSVAVVLLVMSLADKGIVPFEAAMALVIGANVGSALNPLLEGSSGSDPAGRRVAVGNMINRLVGLAVVVPLLGVIGPAILRYQPDLGRAVADFHTAFNLVLAVLFLPLLGPLARLLKRWFPTRVDAADPGQPEHLDQGALETPPIALGLATREALRMVDVLETMLKGASDALDRGDRARIGETRRMDDVLDRLNAAIKAYVMALDVDSMTRADRRRAAAILRFSINLEHAGDIIEKNVMALAAKRLKRGLQLSRQDREEMRALIDRLEANLRAAASVFVTEDARAARILADEKAAFRDLEAKAMAAHFGQLRGTGIAPAETSPLHLDLLRDLKRVNDHLVAGAAYPVLQGQGELLSSRVREPARDAPDEDPE
ncbi:Na/Pi cotransporter family protein [Enterovirga aerilata]|uniref:Na/Pi cotransporter family protein n=1 Tax=Enterovirga aerilata TaxID=2730920 RepID=A0A849IB30_9HYPH|nr:Na/Pi cotransporter family protein [Enterovirga sp. DB1703]NNM73465.1 Na/Pi cotransporter family protein [Enterovirga sp. DB1703]